MPRAWLLAALVLGAAPAEARVFPESPFSDAAAGTTGATFLKIPSGARAQAMGGAGAAAIEGSEALFWNPAGLAGWDKSSLNELSASYSALLETSHASALAFAHPLAEDRGTLGASLLYFSQSEIQGFTTTGDPDGSFAPRDMALSLGYARSGERFSAGGAVRVLRSELAGASGSSFAADFGIRARGVTDIGEGPLDLALCAQNFGPPIKLGGVSAPLPFVARGGSLWRVSPRLNGLLDLVLPVDESPYVALGGEFHGAIGDSLKGALRAGYNMHNAHKVDGFAGVTAGFGLEVARVRVDYAWVPLGDLGTTHRITIAGRF
ncbi:MAG TPA: PorV/PorQ family protein, partial [Elusimicrobiota bacterium]|nr:PorV/PorQ family protein [Elusimicrobiota bacterium]